MIDEEKCDLCEEEVFCTCGCRLCKDHFEESTSGEYEDLAIEEYKAKIGTKKPVDTVKVCLCCGIPAPTCGPNSGKYGCACRLCVFCITHDELWLKEYKLVNYTTFVAKYSKPPLDKDGYQIDGVF